MLFSDVPENKTYKWTLSDSLSVYLEPSGSTGGNITKTKSGSNGLATDMLMKVELK